MQTIMIVEDDPDIRDGVRILLSGEGYRILEAENGPRALRLLTPEVDLVILDIMMPGMSGLRVYDHDGLHAACGSARRYERPPPSPSSFSPQNRRNPISFWA